MSQRNLRLRRINELDATPSADELIVRHVRLVPRLAREIQKRLPATVSIEDIIGAGNLGLVEAARRFDESRGTAFDAFARYRIRGAVTDWLRGSDMVSRELRSKQKIAERTIWTLAARLGRDPSEAEIASHLGHSEEDWAALKRRLCDAGIPADNRQPRKPAPPPECLPATCFDPERQTELTQLREALSEAMQTLPARYRTVIVLHYYQGWTLTRISTLMGINTSRVSQIRSAALKRLREQPAVAGKRDLA